MEKPELEKVIGQLEKLNIQEWSASNSFSYKRYKNFCVLTAKTDGLVFNIRSFPKEGMSDMLSWFNDTWYVISVQDECQKVFVEYKEDLKKGKINKIYEKLCKDLQEFKKDEFNRRVQDFMYGLGPGKKDIEKIIKQLEGIDFKEWETDLKIGEKKHKPKRPSFVAKMYGLNIHVQKGRLGYYSLKIDNSEGDAEMVYGEDSDFKIRRAERELIKRLYERLYKELENKEKRFEEKLNNFLSK